MPMQIDAGGNAALLAMLLMCSMCFVGYIGRAWHKAPTWRLFYNYENKGIIALFTVFSGITIKTTATWWAIHQHMHGRSSGGTFMLVAFIAGTLIAVWGLVCLLRAVSRYDWPPATWFWLAVSAIGFGAVVSFL